MQNGTIKTLFCILKSKIFLTEKTYETSYIHNS